MQDKLKALLKRKKADHIDIRIEKIERTGITFKGKDPDTVTSTAESGGSIRVLYRGGWGFSTFNDLEDLGSRLDEAYSSALAAQTKKITLAEAPVIVDVVRPRLKGDARGLSLKDKVALLKRYSQTALKADRSIVTTSGRYGDSTRDIIYANCNGTYIEQSRQDVVMYLGATARKGDDVEQAHLSLGRLNDLQFIFDQEESVRETALRAAELLKCRRVEGGTYTVIADPDLAGVFAHEAFGHLSEADHLYKNDELRKIMKLGKRFGSKDLNILDGAALPNLRGSYKYDDEGVPSTNTYLIKAGRLVGRLHSRETAGVMGERPTGNARVMSYRHMPIVRMTNTYIDKGNYPLKKMFKEIDKGIYIKGSFGGQTAMENFTFSSEQAFMIENGEIAEPLRAVNVMGNLFQTLKNIDAIAKDLSFNESAGGCGKGGQSPLPVSNGSPHIRICDCVVGG